VSPLALVPHPPGQGLVEEERVPEESPLCPEDSPLGFLDPPRVEQTQVQILELGWLPVLVLGQV